jgi:aspartate racemase
MDSTTPSTIEARGVAKASMGKWLRIGIIGGFGPRASAHFYELLVARCSERYQAILDSDYPYIILASLASKGLSETGTVNEAILIPDLEEAFSLFDKLGIGVAAVPCCSIYAYLDRIAQHKGVQIVDLYREIVEVTFRLQAKDAEILCSSGLRSMRALDPLFLSKGIELHYPEVSIQKTIDQWIVEVMGGRHSTQTTKSLLKLVDKLMRQRDAVVIACSELSVLVGSSSLPNNVFDSMRILADATLRSAHRYSDHNC